MLIMTSSTTIKISWKSAEVEKMRYTRGGVELWARRAMCACIRRSGYFLVLVYD